MVEQGTLAITARGDGSRWYGRISIPESSARAAGLFPGTKISARCSDGAIQIRADEQGRIRLPPARGKLCPRHAFEAATSTLGLKEVPLAQTPSTTEISEGQIRILVPHELIAGINRVKRKPRREPVRVPARNDDDDDVTPPKSVKLAGGGAAEALVTEAKRAGKNVRPLSIERAIEILTSSGYVVSRLGPRLFNVNGESASVSDIAEMTARAVGASDHDRVVIVLN